MFNVYVTKDVCEDNFENGEVGKITTVIYNDKIATVTSYQAAIDKINDYLDHVKKPTDEIEFNADQNCLQACFCETEYGDVPSEADITRWKKDECKLFNAYYSFILTTETEVDLSKFQK